MRIEFHPFSGGLWVAGSRVVTPKGAMRRYRGASPVPTMTWRTRAGLENLRADTGVGTPHSVTRYGTNRYVGTGTVINGFGIAGGSAVLAVGLNGDRLTFVQMPIDVTDDYLFVAGGGRLFKVPPAGASTNWGIVAPTNFAFQSIGEAAKVIDSMEVAADWIPTGAVIRVNDTVIKEEGTASMKMSAQLPTHSGSLIRQLATADDLMLLPEIVLSTRPFQVSSIHDYVAFWLRIDKPGNLEFIQIDFDCDDGSFNSDVLSRLFIPEAMSATQSTEQQNLPSSQSVTVIEGFIRDSAGRIVAGVPDKGFLHSIKGAWRVAAEADPMFFITTGGGGAITVLRNASSGGPLVSTKALPVTNGRQIIPANEDTWTRLLVPKSSFTRSGLKDAADWNTIKAIRISMKANSGGGVNVWIDDLKLIGGYGLEGAYQYKMTYRNSATGTRSNSNPDPVTIPAIIDTGGRKDDIVRRNTVRIGGFPPPTDPQVDQLEFWRTVGNGAAFFRLDRISPMETSYDDVTADYFELGRHHNYPASGTITAPGTTTATMTDISMWDLIEVDGVITASGEQRTVIDKPSSGVVTLELAATWSAVSYKFENSVKILDTEELPLDNIPPAGTYNDAEGPHEGRMWWCRDSAVGAGHRLYYSPAGRPEAVQGFIELTHPTDTTQKVVRWNASLYCLTLSRLFQIFGETEPFQFKQIGSCPGTRRPFTVVPTPLGIFYQSYDGVRLFNGQDASLVGFEALGPLFRGETAEDIPPFDGVVACYARNEYIISDGVSTTLALNTTNGTWRNLGFVATALSYDAERDEILATLPTGRLVNVEKAGQLTDFDEPIEFEWETSAMITESDRVGLVQRLYVEANCNDQVLSPTLILDNAVIELPDFTGPNGIRQFEFSVNRTGRVVGLRIAGAATKQVEVMRVAAQVRYSGEA